MSEDRTSEFLALAQSLPPSYSSGGGGRFGKDGTSSSSQQQQHASSQPPSSMAKLKDFHVTASGISRDIASTSAMLGELTRLVRQKSMFVDDSSQMNELVIRIKQSIENLNGRLESADQMIQQQKRSLGKNHHASQEASNIVGQLQQEFVTATAGFKKVLQQRTDSLKETSDRKRQVYGADASKNIDHSMEPIPLINLDNKPPVYDQSGVGGGTGFPTLDLTSGIMTTGEPTGSQLPRPHGSSGITPTYDSGMRLRRSSGEMNSSMNSASSSYPTYSGSTSTYYGGTVGGDPETPLTPFDIQRMEQGQEQQMQLIPDQDYLRERANAMEQVESNIVELGTIFNKLAVMVSEHRDLVHRVEDNVDDANTNITLSLNTLTDTFTNLQTNRALFFKIMGVLVVFIIFFIMFFA